MVKKDIGYIKLNEFTKDAANNVSNAFRELKNKKSSNERINS